MIIVKLLAKGCPRQTIVFAFGLDERTVADWEYRAGLQCEKVQQQVEKRSLIVSLLRVGSRPKSAGGRRARY